MSGPVNLLDAFPFGGAGVSVKVGGRKGRLGTGGQEPETEVTVAPAMDMGGRRRRHTKKGGQEAGRRRKHTKKGGQEAGRRHRSRKH
jgi:hypothetical protein